MTLKEALQVVLELAQDNIIDDPDFTEEANKQLTACNLVSHFFSVTFEDD